MGVYAPANPATFAGEIAGPPYNYEWRVDVANGDTDWSNCLGLINVQFTSMDSTYTTILDQTDWQGYDAPTAVHLTRFTAGRGRGLNAGLVAASVLVLLVGGVSVWRTTSRLSRR